MWTVANECISYCLDVLLMLTHHFYAFCNCLIEFESFFRMLLLQLMQLKRNDEKKKKTDNSQFRKEHNSQQNRNYVYELVSTITMHDFQERKSICWRQRKTHRYHQWQIYSVKEYYVHGERENEWHLTQVVFVHRCKSIVNSLQVIECRARDRTKTQLRSEKFFSNNCVYLNAARFFLLCIRWTRWSVVSFFTRRVSIFKSGLATQFDLFVLNIFGFKYRKTNKLWLNVVEIYSVWHECTKRTHFLHFWMRINGWFFFAISVFEVQRCKTTNDQVARTNFLSLSRCYTMNQPKIEKENTEEKHQFVLKFKWRIERTIYLFIFAAMFVNN